MPEEDDLLLESLLKPGFRVSKLKLSTFPETGRGLQATTAIRRNEILLTIPRRYLLNLKIVGSEFGFDWRKPPIQAHAALAVYILYLRQCGSNEMTSYISSLPRSFDTVPLMWTDDLARLLPQSTKAYVERQQTVFKKHYAAAQVFVQQYRPPSISTALSWSPPTREDFLWAWLVVNSRCIFQELSPTSSRDDNYACCPLVDMINHIHSDTAHCKLSYDIKGLSVISEKPYRTGEEAFISYGAHTNEALLCEYGFVLPYNPDNSISISENILKMISSEQSMMLMQIGYFEDYTISFRGVPSFRTEVAMRASLLKDEQLDDDSPSVRRFNHFVDGHSDGSQEQEQVDHLLQEILHSDLAHCREMLGRCQSKNSNVRLIAQLWTDRMKIINACIAYTDKRRRDRR